MERNPVIGGFWVIFASCVIVVAVYGVSAALASARRSDKPLVIRLGEHDDSDDESGGGMAS